MHSRKKSTLKYSRICGTGSYLPKNKVSNLDLEQRIDTTDAWIQERTGIKFRHISAKHGESTVDMAKAALEQALKASHMTYLNLDLILVATCTAESRFPSVAAQLQQHVGTRSCPAFDINSACSGFIYALMLADSLIKSGQNRHIAVIGVERMSSIIDWDDRNTCVLFGDGAGAVILGDSHEPGILSTHIRADGKYSGLLKHDPIRNAVIMEGNKVFKIAVKTLGDIVEETLHANQMQTSDIDWLIPHQANLRIILATAQKLKLPPQRVVITIDQHGNTSSASIPLALDSAVRSGRIQRGETMLLETFGAGFTWGSAMIIY